MAAIENAAQRSIAKDLGIRARPSTNIQPESKVEKKPRRPVQTGGSNYGYGFGQVALYAQDQDSAQGSASGPSETRIGQWEAVEPASTVHNAVRMLQNQESDHPRNQRLATMTYEADETIEIAPFEMKKRRPRLEARASLDQISVTSQDLEEKEDKLKSEEIISAPTELAEPLLRAKEEEEIALPQDEEVVPTGMFRKRKRSQARVA